jgi:hypothetical protein
MKTKIVSKNGRIFLIYRGEDYGSYPAGLISVERRGERSLVVRLGVNSLFAESIENTLIGDTQLELNNFEELTKGISGGSGGMSAADKAKLDVSASTTYVNEQIAAAALNTFQREYNGEVGIGVAVIPSGDAPDVEGEEGDRYFTLAYNDSPDGLPVGWIVICWEYENDAWGFSSTLLPIAAVDLHWVAVKKSEDISGYYIIKTGDTIDDLPQWELLGAEVMAGAPFTIGWHDGEGRLMGVKPDSDNNRLVLWNKKYDSSADSYSEDQWDIQEATTTCNGLLSAIDKTNLDKLAPDNLSYGVEIDTTVANPALTRIGNPALHVTLPIQSKMRRCLLNDDGTVNYYLHATDSTKKEDGTPADLSGASGQVMAEIPEHWRKFEFEGTKWRVLIAEFHLPGFHFVPKVYRSAYEAAIDRTVTGAPKLASVVNTSAFFRGGNNTDTYDGTTASLLGKPGTYTSLTNYRTYARRRGTAGKNGAGWNCDVYDIQKTCYWLFVVEYANLNCQTAYNAQPTGQGYKQGGLGAGVTTLASAAWGTFNAYNPFIPCGYTNSLGNRTGVVDFAMPAEYGATLTVQVPGYRGIENPFGHIWSWTDGCKCRISADVANGGTGLSEFFICNDPSKFQDSNYNDYEKRGDLPRNEGYVKEMLIGEFGENMPKTATGASSATWFSDYFYTNIPASGEAQRGILFGGSANYGATAGFGSAGTSNAASYSDTTIGSRLCFIPA